MLGITIASIAGIGAPKYRQSGLILPLLSSKGNTYVPVTWLYPEEPSLDFRISTKQSCIVSCPILEIDTKDGSQLSENKEE